MSTVKTTPWIFEAFTDIHVTSTSDEIEKLMKIYRTIIHDARGMPWSIEILDVANTSISWLSRVRSQRAEGQR